MAAFQGLRPCLLGRDPAQLEEMRFLIASPTASLYDSRTQVPAALEFARRERLAAQEAAARRVAALLPAVCQTAHSSPV